MSDPTIQHVHKTTPHVVAECVAEGKVDLDRLRAAAFRGDRSGLR
jgi:hypothetical protein